VLRSPPAAATGRLRHAGGCVERNRKDVFAVPHPLDVEHRSPQQARRHRDERALQQTEREQSAHTELAAPLQRDDDQHDPDEY
jgi:hypothetical protein